MSRDPNKLQSGWTMEDIRSTCPERPFNGQDGRVKAIREKFQKDDGKSYPFSVPGCPDYLDFLLLMASLLEDPWCSEHLLIVSFSHLGGGRIIGIASKKDKAVWESQVGKTHLKSDLVFTYGVEEYTNAVVQTYMDENLKKDSH